MSSQYEIFKHFGVQTSKRKDLVKSQTFERTREVIMSAIYDSAWIGIAGPIGSGKTETTYAVLDELADDKRFRAVEVFSPDRQGITIIHMLNSIIYQIGEEFINRSSPRRDKEARTMQTLNILASAKKKGKQVVLVVDEAQELHHMTIKALKRLHEYRFMGQKEMLTILMVGQEGLMAKVERDDEIRPRCDLHPFQYTKAELAKIAEHHSFGRLNAEDARTVAERFGTPLEIRTGIYNAMRTAYQIGASEITLKHFELPEARKAPETPPRSKVSVAGGDAENVNEKLKNAS